MTNPVEVIETLYRLDLDDRTWIAAIARALSGPLKATNLGIVGGLFDCPDPCSFSVREGVVDGVPAKLESSFRDGLPTLTPIFVADSFLSRSIASGSAVRGWSDIPPVKSGAFRAVGAADALALCACEPSGVGLWLASFQPTRVQVSDQEWMRLTNISRHLRTAHRLRRRAIHGSTWTTMADAVLVPGGGVCHAGGAAAEPRCRDALQLAARDMEHSRARGRRSDPEQAVRRWQHLVAGRWTLVEHLECDGRRYLVAVDNRPARRGLDLLSARERDVLRRALNGEHNKAIAYDLGIAHSTVRVLIARAAAKLGARSRGELIRKVGGLLEDGTTDAFASVVPRSR